MKKLTLQLDDLQVESFRTADGEALRGTVRGNSFYCSNQIDCTYDYGCETEAASCNGTCHSCADTCGASCYGSCDATCGSCNPTCGSCDYSCYESGCACTVQWSACGVDACP